MPDFVEDARDALQDRFHLARAVVQFDGAQALVDAEYREAVVFGGFLRAGQARRDRGLDAFAQKGQEHFLVVHPGHGILGKRVARLGYRLRHVLAVFRGFGDALEPLRQRDAVFPREPSGQGFHQIEGRASLALPERVGKGQPDLFARTAIPEHGARGRVNLDPERPGELRHEGFAIQRGDARQHLLQRNAPTAGTFQVLAFGPHHRAAFQIAQREDVGPHVAADDGSVLRQDGAHPEGEELVHHGPEDFVARHVVLVEGPHALHIVGVREERPARREGAEQVAG